MAIIDQFCEWPCGSASEPAAGRGAFAACLPRSPEHRFEVTVAASRSLWLRQNAASRVFWNSSQTRDFSPGKKGAITARGLGSNCIGSLVGAPAECRDVLESNRIVEYFTIAQREHFTRVPCPASTRCLGTEAVICGWLLMGVKTDPVIVPGTPFASYERFL